MGAFDEILKGATEEDRAVLQKYPALTQSFTELDELREKYPDVDRRLSTFENWWRANVVGEGTQAKTKAQLAAEAEAATLREQNQKLQEGLDTEMTFEEILQQAKLAGVPLKADVEQMIQESLNSAGSRFAPVEAVDARKKEIETVAGASQYAFEELMPIILEHKDRYGENLSPREIFQFMDKNKITDYRTAYDRMVAPRAQEAAKAAQEAHEKEVQEKIEAARREGEEKARREQAMGSSGRIPTDQGGTAPAMGHLQRQQLERAGANKATDDVPPPPEKTKLGDGVLAQLGYEELVKSRTGTVQ